MNLSKKKLLASKALAVAPSRIRFNNSRLSEIKEAITKQDIRDLFSAGALTVREVSGRKTNVKRTTRRRMGSIGMKVKPGKREYIIMTRKFRKFVAGLLRMGKISKDKYTDLRKQIRARSFKSLAHLKENIQETK